MGFTDGQGAPLYWARYDVGCENNGETTITADIQSMFTYNEATNIANRMQFSMPSLEDFERLIKYCTVSVEHKEKTYSPNDSYCDMPYWVQGSWRKNSASTNDVTFYIIGYAYGVNSDYRAFGKEKGNVNYSDGKLRIGAKEFKLNSSSQTLVSSDGVEYVKNHQLSPVTYTILNFKSKLNGETIQFVIDPRLEKETAQAVSETHYNFINVMKDVPIIRYWTNSTSNEYPNKRYIVQLSESYDGNGAKPYDLTASAKLRLIKRDIRISVNKEEVMNSIAKLFAEKMAYGSAQENTPEFQMLRNNISNNHSLEEVNGVVLTPRDWEIIEERAEVIKGTILTKQEEEKKAQEELQFKIKAHKDSVIASSPLLSGIAELCNYAERNKTYLFDYFVATDNNSVRARVCENKNTQKLYSEFWKIVKKYTKPCFEQESGESTKNGVKGKPTDGYILENEYTLFTPDSNPYSNSNIYEEINGNRVYFLRQYFRTRYQCDLTEEERSLFDELLSNLYKTVKSSLKLFVDVVIIGESKENNPLRINIEPICPLPKSLYYMDYKGGIKVFNGQTYSMPYLQYKYEKDIPLYEIIVKFDKGVYPIIHSSYKYNITEVNNQATTMFEGARFERKFEKYYDSSQSYKRY